MYNMRIVEDFTARGHPEISATHRTTLELTKDRQLTPKGDCVVAVASSKGLADLSPEFKQEARSPGAVITMALRVGSTVEVVKGRGHPALTFVHPTDFVVRKSSYTCSRTLMVQANRAAADFRRETVVKLQNDEVHVSIRLTVLNVDMCRGGSQHRLPLARRAGQSA